MKTTSYILVFVAIFVSLSELLLRIFNPIGLSFFADLQAKESMIIASTDPLLVYEFPAHMRHVIDYEYQTNALGFRGNERRVEKPADTYRVVMLGDSVVFGLGVSEEDTFSLKLEKDLEALLHRHVEVWNTGVPSYNIVQYYSAYKTKYQFVHPNLVIVLIVSNDGTLHDGQREAWSQREEEGGTSFRIPGTWNAQPIDASTPFYRFEYLHGLLKSIELMSRTGKKQNVQSVPDSGWDINFEALLALQRLTDSESIPLLVFSERDLSQLKTFSAEHHLRYESLNFGEAKDEDLNLRVSRLDAHPSPAGHTWIASRIGRGKSSSP